MARISPPPDDGLRAAPSRPPTLDERRTSTTSFATVAIVVAFLIRVQYSCETADFISSDFSVADSASFFASSTTFCNANSCSADIPFFFASSSFVAASRARAASTLSFCFAASFAAFFASSASVARTFSRRFVAAVAAFLTLLVASLNNISASRMSARSCDSFALAKAIAAKASTSLACCTTAAVSARFTALRMTAFAFAIAVSASCLSWSGWRSMPSAIVSQSRS